MNAAGVPNELWLKSAQTVGPWPTIPSDQLVAEILVKYVWAGYTANQQIPFEFGAVDRPQAGTAVVAFHHSPPNQPAPVPMDGLRYLTTTPEATHHTTATVHCPTTIHSPQLFPHQVTIECITRPHGHFPPTHRGQPIAQGSAELRLTRFRKRWRIVQGAGHPGLCLYWWGQDQAGGAPNLGEAPMAPQGWDSQPCRNYPIPPPPSTEPIFVFPSRARPAATIQLPSGPPGQPAVGMGAPGTPAQPMAGSPGGFGQGYAGSPGQRPPMPGMPSATAAQMAAYQQQQQMQQQYLAQSQQGGYPGQGGPPQGYPGQAPPNAYAIQQQMLQLQQQQQQRIQQQAQQSQLAQQQQQQAQQAQAQAALRAQQQAQLAQARAHKGQAQSAQMAVAQAAAAAAAQAGPGGPGGPLVPPPPLQIMEDMALFSDTLDVLSARHLALARFAKNHDLLASIFDPWTEAGIVQGEQRQVETHMPTLKTKRVGSIVSAAGGEDKDEEAEVVGLTELAVRGASVPKVREEKGEIVVEKTLSLEERRNKLLEMQASAEADARELELKWIATQASLASVVAQ